MDCVRVDTAAGIGGIEKALAWLPERTGNFEAAFGMGERRRGSGFNFLAANLIRTFSPETWYDRWAGIALGELRGCGFNTVANWSDWQIARKAAFPYVRPLSLRCSHCRTIYRDFPEHILSGIRTRTPRRSRHNWKRRKMIRLSSATS